MAHRTLRIRIVELGQEGTEFTTSDSECGSPSAEPEKLSSVSEQTVGALAAPATDETSGTVAEDSVDITRETPALDPSNLQGLLAGMLTAIRESQSSVEAKLNKIEKSNAKLEENSRKLQSSVESKLNKLEESLRADIKAENDKLIRRFESQNQKLSKEFSEELNSETRKFTHLLSQVQKETEAELVEFSGRSGLSVLNSTKNWSKANLKLAQILTS
jgi:DNA anti-recombination protein RmuC